MGELVKLETPLNLTRYHTAAAALFVDMVGFTAYCSKMAPEEVIALLRELLALLIECVFSQHGIIDIPGRRVDGGFRPTRTELG